VRAIPGRNTIVSSRHFRIKVQKIVRAQEVIRKMRGGSQAHLIRTDDDRFYVVKLKNNPQHRRVLINESIAAALLTHLKIETPPAVLVMIDEDFIQTHLELAIALQFGHISPTAGLHFGSQYPGDPAKVAVYDFLPDPSLAHVNNSFDFLSILAFDKWVCNADMRQAVFVRDRRNGGLRESQCLPRFKAVMIDQGHAFSGESWKFCNSPVQGLYPRKVVYNKVTSLGDFEECLSQLIGIPHSVLTAALNDVPAEWMEGDEGALQQLLEKLWCRRKGVAELIEDSNRVEPSLFPSWLG
jgi:hypothetical protein